MKHWNYKLIFCIVLIAGNISCDPSSNQSTFNKGFAEPEWANEVVWYQIFPERFRNGDTSNDPSLSDQKGCWPHELIEPWHIHPWNSDWYELQEYELANGKDLWYNITRRRYGGDLQGIIDKLDYLQKLGIGAIYLNPVFVAPSHHKYDISYHHHIDPNFGPNPEKDWQLIHSETPDKPETWIWTSADSLGLKLIEEVHKRGMKIIFDGVFNHVGYNNFAIQDVRKNQEQSRFRDWFTITSWKNEETGSEFEYEGWWGIKDMPELREDSNGIVQHPRKYIFDITRRWMDPNGNGDVSKGIDGWRLDVADQVHHNFWKEWRGLVKSINPEAYITGEIIDTPEKLKPYLEGDEFDAVMNYNFAFLASEFFVNEKTGLQVSEFDSALQNLLGSFRHDVNLSMQNLLGSHDTHRASSRIVNRDQGSFLDKQYFFDKTKAYNESFNTGKPSEDEYDILKLMVIFQMTFPGAPMVYYGDEVGMWGAHDPCCRKPMIWEDISYDHELFFPDESIKRNPDIVEVNQDLLAHYTKLINIRNLSPALQKGTYKTILVDNEKRIFAFLRTYKNDSVLVVINNHREDQLIRIPITENSIFDDLLNEGKDIISEGGTLSLKAPSKWALILKNKL